MVSLSIEGDIQNIAILPSIGTDHSIIISLTLNISQTQPMGKGTWKFNNSLLKDKNYVSMVKKIIQEIQAENTFANKSLLWEFIKCKIRSETIAYSSQKAKLRRKRESELLCGLEKMERQLKSEDNDLSLAEYYSVKKEWEDLYSEKTEGIILRSKVKKNSIYFLNMEKRNYNNKYMKTIVNSDGLTVNDPTKILEEQVNFF